MRSLGVGAWSLIGIMVLVVLVVQALGLVGPAVELVVCGIIIGFICSPVTNALDRAGVPRALAAFLSLLFTIFIAMLIVVALAPPFFSQLAQVLQRIPSYIATIREAFGNFWNAYGSSGTADVQQSLNQLLDTVSNFGLKAAQSFSDRLSSGLVSNVVSMVGGVFTLFLGLVLGYWFAKDYPKIARELATIAGPSHQHDLSVLLAVMSRSMGGYMRGICITSACGGLLSFLGFALIGHPYAGLMGITVGLFHFVPVIGPWLAAALAALLALFVSPMLAIESIVVSVIAQNTTDNLISPLVMQSAVKVHPILSLVGIIVGNSLGGIIGMALAIPLTAAIKSVFVYYFETRSGRQLVSYDGALFKSTPYEDMSGNAIPAYDALDDNRFFRSTLLVPPGNVPPESRPKEHPVAKRHSLATLLTSLSGRQAGRHV